MKIDARLTFNKVQFDQETEAHLVLGFTAPAVSVADRRPPLCIVPLIDVSPSMLGEKFAYAKQSLLKMVDHLSANDYCGLISFSHIATLESKPVKCTIEAKEELKRKVNNLQIGQSTNIADALLKGFEVANRMDLSSEVITRVILFTDGVANTGPAKTAKDILALVKPNIGGSSVSAFGYGSDVDQNFLSNLSKSGNGNYAFVENPDDALSAFGKELGGLLSTYATNLEIEVSPLAGHEIVQVISDVEAEEGSLGQVTIKVPDLLSEETRHITLAVKLKPQKSALPRAVNVFEVGFGYDVLDANLRREHCTGEAKVKAQFVKSGEQQTSVDPVLDGIVGLAQVVRAQIEAEELAKSGKYDQASSVMLDCSNAVGSRGLSGLGVMAQGLSSRMSSRSEYVGSTAYLASFTRGATRGMGGTYDSVAAQDLAQAGVVMSNASQDSVASLFTTPNTHQNDVVVQTQTVGIFPSGWTTGGGTIPVIQDGTAHIGDIGGIGGWGDNTGGGNLWSIHQPPLVSAPMILAAPLQTSEAQNPEKPEKKPAVKRKIKQKSKRW